GDQGVEHLAPARRAHLEGVGPRGRGLGAHVVVDHALDLAQQDHAAVDDGDDALDDAAALGVARGGQGQKAGQQDLGHGASSAVGAGAVSAGAVSVLPARPSGPGGPSTMTSSSGGGGPMASTALISAGSWMTAWASFRSRLTR